MLAGIWGQLKNSLTGVFEKSYHLMFNDNSYTRWYMFFLSFILETLHDIIVNMSYSSEYVLLKLGWRFPSDSLWNTKMNSQRKF